MRNSEVHARFLFGKSLSALVSLAVQKFDVNWYLSLTAAEECVWGEWSEYTNCRCEWFCFRLPVFAYFSVSCGGGRATRHRMQEYNSSLSAEVTKKLAYIILLTTRRLKRPALHATKLKQKKFHVTTSDAVTDLTFDNCLIPDDCSWTEWEAYSACTQICDEITQEQSRMQTGTTSCNLEQVRTQFCVEPTFSQACASPGKVTFYTKGIIHFIVIFENFWLIFGLAMLGIAIVFFLVGSGTNIQDFWHETDPYSCVSSSIFHQRNLPMQWWGQ